MNPQKNRSFLLSPSMVLFYVIFLFYAITALRSGVIFSLAVPINLFRAGIFMMCFAICEMLVIISGGIDISFPSVACVSMCVPMYLYESGLIPDNALLMFGIAALCGLVFGIFNGILVSYLHIVPLIATLATGSIASGGLILFLGAREYTSIPDSIGILITAIRERMPAGNGV